MALQALLHVRAFIQELDNVIEDLKLQRIIAQSVPFPDVQLISDFNTCIAQLETVKLMYRVYEEELKDLVDGL